MTQTRPTTKAGEARQPVESTQAEQWSNWLATYKEGNKDGAERFFEAFMYNAQDAEGTCVHCHEPIYLDIREGGGVTDWRTIDGDYGCDDSPETDNEACGSHKPRKGKF